jgi:cysteine desulfurase
MVHADLALKRLSELGVMAASGSACSSGGQAASPVLTAMGVPRDEALCAVRLSLSVDTPEAALMSLAERWPQSLRSALESTTAPRSPTGVPA